MGELSRFAKSKQGRSLAKFYPSDQPSNRWWAETAGIIILVLAIIVISLLAVQKAEGAELNLIEKTIIAEAVSEGYEGMYAVACVIRNRNGNLKGFVGSRRSDLDAFVKRQGEKYSRMAQKIYKEVFEENKPDITNGATHFESSDFPDAWWVWSMTETVSIGKHTFWKRK